MKWFNEIDSTKCLHIWYFLLIIIIRLLTLTNFFSILLSMFCNYWKMSYFLREKDFFSLITRFLLTICFCCRRCRSCRSYRRCRSCWPFVYFTKNSSKAFITKALGIHKVIRIASSSILTCGFSAWIINICFFIEFNLIFNIFVV